MSAAAVGVATTTTSITTTLRPTPASGPSTTAKSPTPMNTLMTSTDFPGHPGAANSGPSSMCGSSYGGEGKRSSARSPSSSVCSFAGSTCSDNVGPNKYLMKTLCLSKKSPTLPCKSEYANLLTCGLGARKWLASLDFDADSFKAAILNIYPRLSTVSAYTLWNVKPDKTFEKLPLGVNTPKRIKAYLGQQFTGSLVIMPSEEISMGPVKVPMSRNFNSSSRINSGSSTTASNKSSVPSVADSGYDSYQDSLASNTATHEKIKPHHQHKSHQSSRTLRLICLTCGRLAKQVGSTAFYDINSANALTTAEGYVTIAKKLKDLFHIEMPRSKIIPSEQICRKCFRQLNEILFLETQLKRSKEEMMSSFFATVSKISRLEQMARDASSSSSSDTSTTSLGSIMAAAALGPWLQEARYALDHQRAQQQQEHGRGAGQPHSSHPSASTSHHLEGRGDRHPVQSPPQQKTAVALFPSHQSVNGDGTQYVDYNSPQPVFLAPVAGFAHPGSSQSPGKASYEKHDSIYAKRTMVPINMVIGAAAPPPGSSQDQRSAQDLPSTSVATVVGSAPLFMAKPSSPYFTSTSPPGGSRQNGGAGENTEEIEAEIRAEQEAAAAAANAANAAEREHAATAFLEEAYRRRNAAAAAAAAVADASGEKLENGGSSRSSSTENNCSLSSPDSQSPSPPSIPANLTKHVAERSKEIDNKSSSSNGSPSPAEAIQPPRRAWKKRYHEVQEDEKAGCSSTNNKRSRTAAEKKEGSNPDAEKSSNSSNGPNSTPSDSSNVDDEYPSSESPTNGNGNDKVVDRPDRE